MTTSGDKALNPINWTLSEIDRVFRYIASGFVALLIAEFIDPPWPPDPLTVLTNAAGQSWAVVGVFATILGMFIYAFNAAILLPCLEWGIKRRINRSRSRERLRNERSQPKKGAVDHQLRAMTEDVDWDVFYERRWTRRHAGKRDGDWWRHVAFQIESDKWAHTLHFAYACTVVALLMPAVLVVMGFGCAPWPWILDYFLAIFAMLYLVFVASVRHMNQQIRFDERHPEPTDILPGV